MSMKSQFLPHHVVELILERLPVESLLVFMAVSKQWKSTIESRFFEARQLKHRQRSRNPDVLMVSVCEPEFESLRTVVSGPSSSSVKIPTPWENKLYFVARDSFDGLVFLYDYDQPCRVVNPTTRWSRTLPPCKLQLFAFNLRDYFRRLEYELFQLGFGKDKFTGTYKPVWLYNSREIARENETTCEVFDFSTNSWRYVTPSAPYRIIAFHDPVCVDGTLHWFTECEETKVVSFDLHTETFQLLCETPFRNANRFDIVMCNLDNRLCVGQTKLYDNQVIWSFDSSNKTWVKMCSIDLKLTASLFGIDLAPLPLALLEKKKVLFHDYASMKTLAT